MSLLLARRALLRAAGGAAVALPMLELTRPERARAQSAASPRRYVFMYAGLSTGRDGEVTHAMVPATAGAGYELTRALAPLGTADLAYGGRGFDVQNEVSVISGLKIPWSTADGEMPPPGGRSPGFHYNTVGPIVSGMNGGTSRQTRPNGPSHDQAIADALGAPGLTRALSYRVQPLKYVGDGDTGGDAGRISWRSEGGRIVGVDPFVSPRAAYASLFGTFVPPDPTARLEAIAEIGRRRSIVAMLRERTGSLISRMGGSDRERMQRHLDLLRDLEEKLAATAPPTEGACQQPTAPGDDPPLGGSHATDADGNLSYTDTAGYSGEDRRAELMCDFTQLAFACDLCRVVTLRFTLDQTFLNMRPLSGAASDMHELSHGAVSTDAHSDAVGWHVKHFARLVARLRDAQELDGSSLLDHTAIVLCFEGGHGFDPESSSPNRAHSTENMVALVAGRVGGLVTGRHIVATDRHPAHVLITAMQALGLPTDTLGEMTGTIAGLRP